MKRRLKVEPLLINVPADDSNSLGGLIDLPSMMLFEYKDEMGQYVDIQQIDQSHPSFERAVSFREQLIEQLGDHDEDLADAYLSGAEPWQIEASLIDQAIRRAIASQRAVALFCGSALKNKGVQPLIDGIIKYLPSPQHVEAAGFDRETGQSIKLKANSKDELCALAFKVVNDKEKGLVTFFRVYSGILKNR